MNPKERSNVFKPSSSYLKSFDLVGLSAIGFTQHFYFQFIRYIITVVVIHLIFVNSFLCRLKLFHNNSFLLLRNFANISSGLFVTSFLLHDTLTLSNLRFGLHLCFIFVIKNFECVILPNKTNCQRLGEES